MIASINGHQLQQTLHSVREIRVYRMVQSLCAEPQSELPLELSRAHNFDFSEMENEVLRLEASLADGDSPDEVPDLLLFS